jgi:hypothetical protein
MVPPPSTALLVAGTAAVVMRMFSMVKEGDFMSDMMLRTIKE